VRVAAAAKAPAQEDMTGRGAARPLDETRARKQRQPSVRGTTKPVSRADGNLIATIRKITVAVDA
jgi:hypothetical protein